jgi:hypothetical protein
MLTGQRRLPQPHLIQGNIRPAPEALLAVPFSLPMTDKKHSCHIDNPSIILSCIPETCHFPQAG